MRRLGVILFGAGLWLGLGASSAWASNHDLTVHQFFLPASATSGWRVHTSSSTMNVTLQGDINAAGGYKAAFVYAHPNWAVPNLTNQATPIAGSFQAGNSPGVLWHPLPYAGSVVAVSIQASTAITAQAAHAEALLLSGSTTKATGLTAVIGNSLGQTQYNYATQARGLDRFAAGERVGCRITTDNALAPTALFLVCTVHIAY